jgi:hypothetical protein
LLPLKVKQQEKHIVALLLQSSWILLQFRKTFQIHQNIHAQTAFGQLVEVDKDHMGRRFI